MFALHLPVNGRFKTLIAKTITNQTSKIKC